MKPGIYEDMPAADYHAVPAVSSSVLKRLHESSPAHAKLAFKPTSAMDNGSALHCLVLEPSEFEKRYFAATKFKGKGARAMKAAEAADNDGKIPLKPFEMQDIRTAAATLQAHPYVAPILADSKKEVSLFWEEDDVGLCKCRLDMLAPTIIADLKSTRCAQPAKFFKEIAFNLNYWIQAAWYWRGARACGLPVQEFAFIAVEIERPYGVTLHFMDDVELNSLQRKIGEMAATWGECLRTGLYPSYPAVRHYVTLGGDDDGDSEV